MSLQLEYSKIPLQVDKRGKVYMHVNSATEIQIKSLILSDAISKEKQTNTLPFYIESIQAVPFYVKMDLSSMISILSIFKNKEVIVVTDDKKKELTKQSLTSFIFS